MPKEKFTLVMDSSQLSSFLECPELWNRQYRQRLVPNWIKPKDDDPRDVGTYGHKILDLYYKKRALGLDLNDAGGQAYSEVDAELDKACENCNHSIDSHIAKPVIGETDVETLITCEKDYPCTVYKSKPFPLNSSLRLQVKNRLREYFFKYHANDYIPQSADHVEIGFSEPIFEDADNLFVLEGRMDLLATLQGLPLLVDHKFQLRRHDLYPKSIQFKNYALVSKQTMLSINYIRMANKMDESTLKRELVVFNVPELLDWKEKLIRLFFQVKVALQSQEVAKIEYLVNGSWTGTPPPLPQNWAACPGRYGYTCSYTQLCEEIDAQMIKVKENLLYTINPNPWRPW